MSCASEYCTAAAGAAGVAAGVAAGAAAAAGFGAGPRAWRRGRRRLGRGGDARNFKFDRVLRGGGNEQTGANEAGEEGGAEFHE
ncbi:hypothetical protein [Lacunisphaera limnophila]|uniref:hypothetical protein n=1 Tax=Lacunisphaera limnophila TaxID=1838286 RepID=UPI0008597103|nr:hypothetical protein [Lacunisphaera limnophila]